MNGPLVIRVGTNGARASRASAARDLDHRGAGCRGVLVGLGGGLLLLSGLGAAEARADVVGRPSVSTAGTQGNGDSLFPDVSSNGRFVAFGSEASNLVAGDTNGVGDVFVRDRKLAVTTRVSVGQGGAQANGHSDGNPPSLSDDARFVAFASNASNLVPGDDNGALDIFVHDRKAKTTRRVSVASDGTEASTDSYSPSLSADGRFVIFYSDAANLVPGDTNGTLDVFLHALGTGKTERVSLGAGGVQGNNGSYPGGISADGRFVGFWSGASNLVPGDTNGKDDVFVRDRQKGTTTRVSVGPQGRQGKGNSTGGVLSADGRLVAFNSEAPNLVAGDSNGLTDVFVRDRTAQTTKRVSVRTNGAQGDSYSVIGPDSAFSGGGRYVVFESNASTLVPADTNGLLDVFEHDRQSGKTRRVNLAQGGAQATGNNTGGPAISADGRFAVFFSYAPNLIPNDTNNAADVLITRLR